MQYRREIDGLRAVAVVPVILFHAGFELFSGGFVGVDVFFVISGYLITTIIHEEMIQGSFSILGFYERRVRRILPALFFVLIVSAVLAWLWMTPPELAEFGRSLAAVNFFVSNILFWRESGYFATKAEFVPLLHTWSLAVEEQFYIFFPLLMLMVRRYKEQWLLWLIVTFSIVSLSLSHWASHAYPSANFYLLPTRAWELGIGATLSLLMQAWKPSSNQKAQFLSTLGFFLVILSVFIFSKTTPIPSLWSLIPVGGTALIIVFADRHTAVGRMLACQPFVFIGLIRVRTH